MNFAWIIATACAFSMITITQAGNYTIVAVGKDGKLAFDPPLFVPFPLQVLRFELMHSWVCPSLTNFVGGTLVPGPYPPGEILVGGLIFQSYVLKYNMLTPP